MAKDKGEAKAEAEVKAKYRVLKLLWSPSQSRYVHPGETMELGEEIAVILLQKGCVEPAKYAGCGRRSGDLAQHKGAAVGRPRPSDAEKKKTEVEHDTDN